MRERLRGHNTIRVGGEDVSSPAINHAIWTANHGERCADHTAGEDGRKRFSGTGARPVPNSMPVATVKGNLVSKPDEFAQRRLPVGVRAPSVAGSDGLNRSVD